jgi:iron complex transport system substrate-binding protein
MIWWPIRALAMAVALTLPLPLHAATLTDDAGREVQLDPPPRRIVTLAPNLTELVHAVGAGPLIVATGEGSNHPPEVLALPRVADHQRIDIERLVALKPDLVLVWDSGNTMRELAQLESAGVRLFRLEPRRLDDVPRALERVGVLLHRPEEGRARAQVLRRDLATLRERHVGAAPVRVFYQVWSRPLLTLNGQHLVSDVLQACGGRNVFAQLRPLVPQLSSEAVVQADPDAMLTAVEGSAPPLRAVNAAAFAEWTRLGATTAVKGGWLYTVPADLVVRAGPRIADGVAAVCGVLSEVRRERAAVTPAAPR